MSTNIREKIIAGTINSSVSYFFKKDAEISYENPRLVQEIQNLLGCEKGPKITRQKDNITFLNFIYNNIEVRNLSVYTDRIAIRVYNESLVAENIIDELLPKLADRNLIIIIDNQDVHEKIMRKTYNTRLHIKLNFTLSQLMKSDYINILTKIKTKYMKKDKVKRIDPFVVGFAVDIENSGSKNELFAIKTMIFGYRHFVEKEKRICFTVSDFPFEQHINILQDFNDKFAQKIIENS